MSNKPVTFTKKKILLTQKGSPSVQASYKDLQKECGLHVDFLSVTVKQPIPLSAFRKHKQKILRHTAIIFMNSYVMDYFFRFARACHITMPDTTKYFFPNEPLAYYLQKHIQLRKRKVFTGKRGFEDLIPHLKRFKKESYLFPCSNIKRLDIRKFFKEQKYAFSELPIYDVLSNDLPKHVLEDYDLIIFFSALDVRTFHKQFPTFDAKRVSIATFGKATEQAAIQCGWGKPLITAPQPHAPSMRNAITHYMKHQRNTP